MLTRNVSIHPTVPTVRELGPVVPITPCSQEEYLDFNLAPCLSPVPDAAPDTQEVIYKNIYGMKKKKEKKKKYLWNE